MESTPFERSVTPGGATREVRRGTTSRGMGVLIWWVGAFVLLGLCIAEPPLFPLAAVLLVVLVGWHRQVR